MLILIDSDSMYISTFNLCTCIHIHHISFFCICLHLDTCIKTDVLTHPEQHESYATQILWHISTWHNIHPSLFPAREKNCQHWGPKAKSQAIDGPCQWTHQSDAQHGQCTNQGAPWEISSTNLVQNPQGTKAMMPTRDLTVLTSTSSNSLIQSRRVSKFSRCDRLGNSLLRVYEKIQVV